MLDLELPAGAAEDQPSEIHVDVTQILRYRVGLNIRRKNKGNWEMLSEDAQVTLAEIGDTSQTGRESIISRNAEGTFNAGYVAPGRYRLSVKTQDLAVQHPGLIVLARRPEESVDHEYAFGIDENGQIIDLPGGVRGR